MLHITADLGNTRLKICVFRHKLPEKEFHAADLSALMEFLHQQEEPFRLIISNVGRYDLKPLSEKGLPFMELTSRTPLPLTLLYKTPETLGVDRIALSCGAQAFYPLQPVLVIDAGTCITYDFKDKQARYHGGAISPGINMRLQAMHHFTARLPAVTLPLEKKIPRIGQSTRESMLSGAVNGARSEVTHVINWYCERYPSLITLITGGDADWFAQSEENSIFAAPKLLPTGLNNILEFNAERF